MFQPMIITLKDSLGVYYDTLMNTEPGDRLKLAGYLALAGMFKDIPLTTRQIVDSLPFAGFVVVGVQWI